MLEDVAITDLSFGSEYSRAVEAKQVAQQEAQRAAMLVERAKQERQQKIVEAEGEAKSASLIGEVCFVFFQITRENQKCKGEGGSGRWVGWKTKRQGVVGGGKRCVSTRLMVHSKANHHPYSSWLVFYNKCFCPLTMYQAIAENPGFLELRRIDAAREIAGTLANSANRVYLDANQLLLNVDDFEFSQ